MSIQSVNATRPIPSAVQTGGPTNLDLSVTVLDGMSSAPPGIDGDGLFGVVAAWADNNNGGTITVAISESVPPYAPVVLNPSWTSFDSPAVALASDWEQVFVAFADSYGYVQLATSGDEWVGTQTLSAEGVDSGPALAYANGVLYIAWKTAAATLAFATCDENGVITYLPTDQPLTSRPTICVDDPARVYILCGGSVETGPAPILVYVSLDGGQSFSEVSTQATTSIGPPSLVVLDKFYMAWADGDSSTLRLAETADLASFEPMIYADGCHDGGPALRPMVNSKPSKGRGRACRRACRHLDWCASVTVELQPTRRCRFDDFRVLISGARREPTASRTWLEAPHQLPERHQELDALHNWDTGPTAKTFPPTSPPGPSTPSKPPATHTTPPLPTP